MPTQVNRDGTFNIEIDNFAGSVNTREDPRSRQYPESNSPDARDNVYFGNGSVMKRFGYDVVDKIASMKGVRGMIPFRPEGASETKMLVFIGDDSNVKMYTMTPSDLTLTEVGTYGVDDEVPVNGHVAQNLAIFGNGHASNVVKKYDGTTMSNLGGDPPKASIFSSINNTVLASGIRTAPSTVEWPVPGDVENWAGANSGAIGVEPGDNSEVRSLKATQNLVLAFKDYDKYGLNQVFDANEFITGFAQKDVFDRAGGALAHGTVAEVDDGFIFLSERGFRQYGVVQGSANFRGNRPLSTLIKELLQKINFLKITKAASAVDDDLYMCALPYDGSTKNSVVFVYDFTYSAWRMWRMPVGAFGRMESVLGGRQLYFGHSGEGKICKFNKKFVDDAGTKGNNKAIEFYWKSKFFAPGLYNRFDRFYLLGSTTQPGKSYITLTVDSVSERFLVDGTDENILIQNADGKYVRSDLFGMAYVGGYDSEPDPDPEMYRFLIPIDFPAGMNEGREVSFCVENLNKNEGLRIDRALLTGKILPTPS